MHGLYMYDKEEVVFNLVQLADFLVSCAYLIVMYFDNCSVIDNVFLKPWP